MPEPLIRTGRQALAFVRRHGVVLASARGPVPSLAQAIAGEPIRGTWWAHPRARQIYRLLTAACESEQVLVCRLVRGKLTLVHRRLWPALVCLSRRLPKAGLAAVREEHTSSGKHRAVRAPFPGWVPGPILQQGRAMDGAEALRLLGSELAQTLLRAARP